MRWLQAGEAMNTTETPRLPTSVRTYCDGAAMAYRDVAAKLRNMVDTAPPELRTVMEAMLPFAESCEKKAVGVYDEALRHEAAVLQ